MSTLNDANILRQIIMDHYENPRNRGLIKDNSDGYISLNMDSQTCIDNVDMQVKINDDIIEDIRFDGEACAICTATTSIMSELLIGKSLEEANSIIDNYMNMIYEREYNEEVLEEAIAFKNTYKQANRIKCATLTWNGMKKIIDDRKEG